MGYVSRELMLRAVVFDLFETLVPESRTRPPGVSSLAAQLGCERAAFRTAWLAVRPDVMAGRLPFRQALGDIAVGLGGHPDEATLQRISDERARTKAAPFEEVESEVERMLDDLVNRGLILGLISNCFAEDMAAWADSSLASRFECTVFSCEVGLAKPDLRIYEEATRRLGVDVSECWFIGDGGDDELSGAASAGVRPFRALWFLRRWPHFEQDASAVDALSRCEDLINAIEQADSLDTTGWGRTQP